MKVTLRLYFYSCLNLYNAFGNNKTHREDMGKYDALVAAARSLLLKLKDINITDNGDNRDGKDCPESATIVKYMTFTEA